MILRDIQENITKNRHSKFLRLSEKYHKFCRKNRQSNPIRASSVANSDATNETKENYNKTILHLIY